MTLRQEERGPARNTGPEFWFITDSEVNKIRDYLVSPSNQYTEGFIYGYNTARLALWLDRGSYRPVRRKERLVGVRIEFSESAPWAETDYDTLEMVFGVKGERQKRLKKNEPLQSFQHIWLCISPVHVKTLVRLAYPFLGDKAKAEATLRACDELIARGAAK